ncbi:MAG: type II/IV secretion system protein [Candidatus Dadabacteria bacterium]|nr:MAG: type II/IV secretion system protein [Candidatus Dadabacteria bacterium]
MLQQAAEALLHAGLIDESAVQEIIHHGPMAAARLQAGRVDRQAPTLYETLAALKVANVHTREPLDDETIAQALAAHVGLPFEHIDSLKLDPEFVTRLFSKPFAQRHLMIPLREEEGEVVVACGAPFDEEARQIAQRTTDRTLRFVVGLPNEIDRVLTEFYGFRASVTRAQKQIDAPQSARIQSFEQLVRIRGDRELEASDQHIVNAVDYLFRYAFELNASDIHIEPRRDYSRIRYRIDGVLHQVYTIPPNVHLALISRIKMLARMDIAEKRRPQDGRIRTMQEDRQVEMRVSSMPVATGEKLVIRLFDPQTVHGDLAQLGFREAELAAFRRWIRQPHGIILVTGPTGSGKSTTLYTALLNIASDELNIVTIEDPIEMIFDQFNQVAVQPQAGVTFASALRTILRQDPDVIMVGEVRDRDTAQHAVQAAITGHLVFSTLHTNDSATAIPRLVDLGVEPFLLASSLTGVMAQRLVRRLCTACAEPQLLPAGEWEALGGAPADEDAVSVMRAVGCPSCRGTGYKGRVAVVEMLEVGADVRTAIEAGVPVDELRDVGRRAGMRSLREAGLDLVRDGLTTVEEVLRVTSDFDS